MQDIHHAELHTRREALAFSISQVGLMAVTMWCIFFAVAWLGWQAGAVWPVVVLMSMATFSAAWRVAVLRWAGDPLQLQAGPLARIETLVQTNMLFAGMMWAFATVTIYPRLELTGALVYVAFQFAAVAFTGFFVSAMRSGFVLHVAPMMAALFVVTLMQPYANSWMLAGLIAVYTLVMIQASRRFRRISLLAFGRGYEMQARNADLQQAMVAAEAAVQAKTRFLATMSHELRTPMSGLLGALDLLTRSPLAEHERRLVDIARSSGSGLLVLLDDVLDYAKIEAGHLALKTAPTAPRDLVQSVVDLFAPSALTKGLAIHAEVEAAVPAWVTADSQRLRQVLLNLVGNAVKFTRQGGIVIRVQALPEGLHFEVQDTGIGIAPADLGQLFQPFHQLNNHSTRPFEGTGLGLAISQRLVQAMGGLIEVHSTPEQGARFGFDIAAPEVAAPWPEPVPQPAPDRMPASLAGRVLFVEDNEVNRCVIGEMLGLLGLTTVEAGDGREAQRLLHHQPFDLVLMDCEMPLQDGFETAQAWRAHEVATARPRLPILALTANTLPEDLARAIASGMDEVLCKPISFEQLRDALGRWLPAAAG